VNALQHNDPRYLTIQEVAARYQLHPETVRRWIIEGRLPAIKLAGGSAWRVREEALVAIEHHTNA
jgi:excisionase family DNA binding protein